MDTQPTVTEPVQDAEVVEPGSDATILGDLESLIKSHITGIDARKAELKKVREMVNDALVNDATYREQEKTAKDAAKIKNATKSQIMKSPGNQAMNEKAKELAAEVKEMDGALSDYLREFQRISGATQIELDDGQVREIVYTAKLVKKQG